MADNTKWRRFVFYLTCVLLNVNQVNSSAEIMHKMTISFSKTLEACKNELNISDNIMQEFFNFWKEEYQLLNRDMGCVILCMASKLNLMKTDDYKMHHSNAHEFAKSHGADDALAKQLVDMIHECEKEHVSIEDHCARTLEIAKCFRTKIHGLKWAPDMELILEEIMAES